MKHLIGLSFCLLFYSLSGQTQDKQLTIQFTPSWADIPIQIPSSQFDESAKDSVEIELLRFYVSGIQLIKKNTVVWSEDNSYHLIDSEENESQSITLNVPKKLKYKEVRFLLGIDSTTNVSGAMGGDLDPTKGMFWSWNTGYINFKLEGSSKQCETRKNKYQFHLGGYTYPDASIQQIDLKVSDPSLIAIAVNLDQFFDQINLAEKNSIMIPGSETQKTAAIAKNIFNTQK